MNIKLIQKLKNYAQNKSVDELKNVQPKILMREFNISDKELKEIVDYLHDKGAMIYKYNLYCPYCKIKHTIYENEIRKEKKECDECGGMLYFKEELKKSNVLFVLDKQEILALDTEINFKMESLKKIIDIDKKRIIKFIKEEKQNQEEIMEIFIGSSTEAAGEIEQIALTIEEKGFKALPWNSCGRGVFRATNFTLENLINVADRVCAAIFIFNSDDEIWYSSDNISAGTIRDNVLFEYGLFLGKKGRNNVVFICKNKPKIASDLKGITYIDADKGEFHMKAELKDWLGSLKR